MLGYYWHFDMCGVLCTNVSRWIGVGAVRAVSLTPKTKLFAHAKLGQITGWLNVVILSAAALVFVMARDEIF